MAKGAKTGGRKPGSPNKNTYGVKMCIIDVFDEIGGVKNFAAWARENPTEFYKHYTRLAPTEVNQTIEIKTDWTDADEKRLSYLTSKLVGLESRANETLQ